MQFSGGVEIGRFCGNLGFGKLEGLDESILEAFGCYDLEGGGVDPAHSFDSLARD